MRLGAPLGRRVAPAAAIALLLCAQAYSGEVYIGAWGGQVPASMEVLSDTTLKICHEDLVRQCQHPVPFHREGDRIVVEHLTSGRKWTYALRPDGAYDGAYLRWNGQGYDLLATAILRPH